MTIDENNDLWFVSDTHFFHKKLVRSCPEHFEKFRNYETVDEMNEDIIFQWNKFISPNDTVIFLGDFGLNIPYKDITTVFNETMNKLNGNKIYIRGNHDNVLVKNTPNIKWLDNIEFDYKNMHYMCQHYDFNEIKPFGQFILNEKYDCSSNILVHGHTHSTARISIVDFATTFKMKQNCVCWEAWYRPVNYKELIPITEYQTEKMQNPIEFSK